MVNHLSGKKRKYIEIGFRTLNDMYSVRNIIKEKVEKNKNKQGEFHLFNNIHASSTVNNQQIDYLDLITDIREYDVQYNSRVCID